MKPYRIFLRICETSPAQIMTEVAYAIYFWSFCRRRTNGRQRLYARHWHGAGRAETTVRELGHRDWDVGTVSSIQNFSIHGRNSISQVHDRARAMRLN